MDYLQKNWKWGIFEGLVLILCGWIAIIRPVLTSLSLAMVVGAVLLVSGIVTGYRTLRSQNDVGYWPSFMSSLCLTAVGLLMLFFPMGGVVTLVGLMTAFFAIQGILQIAMAFSLQHDAKAWGLFLLNGILSLGLAVLVWMGFPSSALWFLGMLFGIHLLFVGTTVLMLSWQARNA